MKNKISRAFFALMLVVCNGAIFAQVPSGYYNNANGKTGDELKIALHDIIKNHSSISYANIWNAFWSTDNKGNGVVWDMYSDNPNGTPPYTFSIGQNQCGEYVQEGDCYNREHSWPQSWFSGDDQAIPSRDLHHVFPTDGFVNAQRSNYPYGEVSSASWTSQNGSKLGTCKSSLGYNGTVFEPIDEYKGDFARALMYVSVRYYGEDSNWGTSGMTNKSEILPWAITMLMDWSDNDPVSQKEIDRNNVIYSDYQHNRNPFVDHPEYARMIWDPNWHGGISGYVKVTSANELTNGDYLIVCENNNVAFDGSLTTLDVVGNKIAVSINGNTIESDATTDASTFKITAKTGGGYSIKSASGYYIGNTSDANALKTSPSDVYTNTISITDGNADIVSSSSCLRYNAANDQTRFRYFKSGSYTNQQAIQLYKKIEAYSITLASVEHGNISANVQEAVEGANIILTATPDEGYELDYWMVTAADGSFVTVTDNQFVMPASNVTVSATFTAVFSQQYFLVTNASQLVAGRTYLIVNSDYSKALGTTQNANNRSAATVKVDDNVIATIGDAVCELVLGGQAGAWTFKDGNVGYLYAAGGGNYLRTQSTLTNNGKWTISITDGTANMVSNGNVSQNTIRFNPNNNNPIFSCYASTSTMAVVQLYIRSEEYDHTESETITAIFPFDKHTVRSGATLTVTGTATCNDASHLILEEGAQLIHNTNGVMATVKKSIEAYANNGGWYTMATPFTTYNPANVLASEAYDLYAYSEAGGSDGKEWVNYKPNGTFSLAAGTGYLYAHNPATTLRMAGTLSSGNYASTVNLGYANSNANLRGFNLLGNPTAHEIVFSKSGQVSDGYYYLDNSDHWIYTTENTVPVGRGFLVKANATGQTVTLNPQNRSAVETVRTPSQSAPYLCLQIGDEKAYVKLGEGVSMPLLGFNGSRSSLYLTRDREPYVMLVRDGADAIDLGFEPKQAGRVSMVAHTEGLAIDYLHLVDLLTGADVDLLAEGSVTYTFEAAPSDCTMRFVLRFAPEAEANANDSFAYTDAGTIVVTADAPAVVELIDMTGRVVARRPVVASLHLQAQPGVYVLRLVSGNDVRHQKVVVR